MEKKEAKSDLDQILTKIVEKSPEGGAYLKMFIEEFKAFETPEFQQNPESILFALPKGFDGLDEDNRELIYQFCADFQDDKETAGNALKSLYDAIKQDYPVVNFLLADFFSYFLEAYINKSQKPDEKVPGSSDKKKYQVPNKLISQVERSRFLRACGLTEDVGGGAGSHNKWMGEVIRQPLVVSTSSNKIWLKTLIKELLGLGMDLKKIERGCQEINCTLTLL